MNQAWNIYQLYAELYHLLTCWLTRYLPEENARKVVRFTLADSFRWATNAVQGLYGPYADAAEAAMGRALGMELQGDADGWAWPMATLPAGDVEFHHRMAQLYSAVYSAVFEADLTLREREAVFMLIRVHNPEFGREIPQPGELNQWLDSLPLVRRVVEAVASHTCDGRLICAVNEQIWREETDKGVRWMREHIGREESNQWQR